MLETQSMAAHSGRRPSICAIPLLKNEDARELALWMCQIVPMCQMQVVVGQSLRTRQQGTNAGSFYVSVPFNLLNVLYNKSRLSISL